jgi:hypothetical protein
METIAVYWEPVIKTYGLDVQKNLSMVSFSAHLKEICANWAGCFQRWRPANRMVLAFARPAGPDRLRLHLLFNGAVDLFDVAALAHNPSKHAIRIDKPVELIQFHGPHFGDRYGIAAAALGALEAMQVPIKGAACCGASVYLVLPENQAETACQALSKAFMVPGR